MLNDSGFVTWTSEMNSRRFALIDKEMRDGLTSEEGVELANLTATMRRHLSPIEEASLQAVQSLHSKVIK